MDQLMKKQKVLTFKPKAEHTSVYVFHNKKYGTNLFVNALGADGAYQAFDECEFTNRSEWIIMLELENNHHRRNNMYDQKKCEGFTDKQIAQQILIDALNLALTKITLE
jgi:hypothetical protein